MTDFVENGKSILPSAFYLDKCQITTNAGTKFDIRDIIKKIDITESLYRSSLEYELYVLDGSNTLELLKISGNEKIDIAFSRKSLDGNTQHYRKEIYIAEIHSFSKSAPGQSTYALRCVSKHAYMNQLKTVCRSFEGAIGPVVKQICIDDLGILEKELTINTDTTDSIKGIIPKFRPLYAIAWLTKNAFDNSTPFYFYETLKSGVVFDSYENMIQKDSHDKYFHRPFTKEVPGSDSKYEVDRVKIRKLSSDYGMSKYIQSSEGAYASTLHTIDIANKQYSTPTYNYNGNQKLNKNNPFSKSVKFDDRNIEEYSNSKSYFVSLNSKSFEGFSNYHTPSNPAMLKAGAYISNLDTMTVTIDIAGDFELSVGDKIELDVTRIEAQKTAKDKLVSGYYIVTSIAHKFGNEYIMSCQIKKDSFICDLDDIYKAEGK
jgi:hypothetical protein|tara:strand:+ start:1000 stop:2292 length:1293 start_codon:yes stop_codon:yes gene_type:complete